MLSFRTSSNVTSPVVSLASSRRSSIGKDNQFGSFINRDPFGSTASGGGGGGGYGPPNEKSPYVTTNYSSHSLPRNFSVKQQQHSQAHTNAETKLLPSIDDNETAHENSKVITPVSSPRLGSRNSSGGGGDGIQRKYRRSHRHPIPLLEKAADCPSEGCANNHKSFNLNFSVLAECWKCNSAGEKLLEGLSLLFIMLVYFTVLSILPKIIPGYNFHWK